LVLDEVDGPLTGDQRESLGKVEKNASHLLKLINDILDLSKIEAGRMEVELHPFDLGGLAAEVVGDLQALADPRGVVCAVVRGDGPLRVVADLNKVREVLNNLVNNAIKFTDHGRVEVHLAAEPRGGRPGVLTRVMDTGIGIPADHLEEVFEAFKQLDGTSTRAHGGTGLGLSIAKRLVELHDGTIWVESQVGKGSSFMFWLPTAGPDPGESSA
jgi:signal transduction histidine kinase